MAGCAGWGTDGPADTDDPASDGEGELEDADSGDDQAGAGVVAGADGADGEGSSSNGSAGTGESGTDTTGNDASDETSDDEGSSESAVDNSDDEATSSDVSTDADGGTDESRNGGEQNDTDDSDAGEDGSDGTDETDGNDTTDDGDEDVRSDEGSGDDGTEMHSLQTTIEVVDEDGNPIEGETITAWAVGATDTADEYTTDEDGRVVLEGQSSDPTDVIEMIVQVGDEERSVFLEEGESTETVTVSGDETHTLTVYAEDVVTGEPATDATYRLQQDNETIGEDRSGEMATFEGLEDGEYELLVYQTGGDWGYSETIAIDGDDLEHTVEVDRFHVYWATVEATVVDGSGDPVEGETVTFNGQATPTDENGTALYDRQFHYAEETEVTVEYDDRSETFVFDNETTATQSVTFETGTEDEQPSLAVSA
ncbi:hypothetical protein [Halalkalicoccus subterraneus]|uniref:hypothetical protein n=1 Tax=Halalkalicoccus subterraneus TaxID=2675002 RepID=UPI000EFC1304|nr:hypothetical protein [Halalkalicoccus subterraneus]